MQDRNDKIEGPFSIEEDLLFRGMITVGAIVRSGVMLDLRGMSTGDIDVERRACAIIHGSVNGMVRNHGGYVHLFGTVDEVADLSSESQTVIDPPCLIKGARHKRPHNHSRRDPAWLVGDIGSAAPCSYYV